MRSAPLGTPRTASRICGSGCRRRAGARLLLAGDNAFEDGLAIIHYCRLGDLLRVVCDEGAFTGETITRGWLETKMFRAHFLQGAGRANDVNIHRENHHSRMTRNHVMKDVQYIYVYIYTNCVPCPLSTRSRPR